MGIKTGNPRGRPPGSKSKRTVEREQAMSEAAKTIEEALEGAFEGDAHALLMVVYKDPSKEMALRIDAAKAAIRYEKPALSTIEAKVEATVDALTEIRRTIVDPRN
jgi:hypothetical protein